jgi:hypothetical protein
LLSAMGSKQVLPVRWSEEEQVRHFLSSKIPSVSMARYTYKEPTFKDCFTARQSWTKVVGNGVYGGGGGNGGGGGVYGGGVSHSFSETPEHMYTRAACMESGLAASMVFISLFFKKLLVINPKSRLFCRPEGG